MKGRADDHLLDLARRVAERRAVDWEAELRRGGREAGAVHGLRRLASLQAAFGRLLRRSDVEPVTSRPAVTPIFTWGHLEALELLGEGTFAQVYRAHDPLLDREVALKLYRQTGAECRGESGSWIEEARRLARVRHPNVVVVHGVDVHDGRAGLWTDLVPGATLEERLAGGPIGAEEACQIGIELCRALEAVHAAGLVHGDVKAANVVGDLGGRVVLMDFGAGSDRIRSVVPSAGTPVAMAPELLRGGLPTPASDLYALSVLLFQLLTGRYPIEAESLDELLAQHERGDRPPSVSSFVSVPGSVVVVLDRAIDPEPSARFATASELEHALSAALNAMRASPSAIGLPGTTEEGASDSTPAMLDLDRLVGRSAELATLQGEFRRSLMGSAHPIVVHGDPGVGKTHLARHFLRWCEQRGAIGLSVRFFADDAGRLAPYEAFLDLLAGVAARLSDDGGERVTDRPHLSAWLAERCGIELPEALLDLGAGPRPARQEAVTDHRHLAQALARSFLRLSHDHPLVVVLDDLQWADESSREVIGPLMRSAGEGALTIVALGRSGELARADHPVSEWLGRQAGVRSFTTLVLEPFDRSRFESALATLVPGPAGTSDIPPEDVRRLFRATGGNPYFVVEMLRLLVSRGTLLWQDEPVPGWRWRRGEPWRLPANLTMAARTQLSQIPEEVREILEAAAIVGDELRLATVSAVVGRQPGEVEPLLERAVDATLLHRQGLSLGEDYGFRHAVIREVLVQGLPPRRQRRLHAAAARALETVYAAEPGRVAAALSVHHEAAGDRADSVRWSLRAWRAARERGEWSQGLRLLRRAADALGDSGDAATPSADVLEIALGTAEAQWSVGRLRESEASATLALELAKRLGDSGGEAAALLQRARTGASLGQYSEAESAADRAQELFASLGERRGEEQARLQLATVRTAIGHYRSAAELLRSLASSTSDSETAAAASGQLGWALALQGRFEEAVPALRRAIEGARVSDDLRQIALRLRRLHWVHLSRGDYQDAFVLARRAYDRSRETDDAMGEAKAIMGMGQARLGQGLCGEAIAYLRRTLDTLAEIGDAHCEAETLWLLGRAHCETGQPGPARRLLERALGMVREIGDRDDEFRFLTDLARTELAAGRASQALLASEAAADIAAELGNRDGLGACRAERARALGALGRSAEALAEAERAVALLDTTDSAERWRGHWALGGAAECAGEDSARAVEALWTAVRLLEASRDQVPADDQMRRREITLARRGPAADLVRLLSRHGQRDEAARVARSWDVGVPATTC